MKNYLMIALVLAVTACTSPKKESANEEDKVPLKEQVMNVHDEVMPKMGELRSTQKSLLAVADSLGEDSLKTAELKQLATSIEMANENMMAWMRQYDHHFTGTDEEVKVYLEGQLKSIQQVKEDMLSSLEAGKKALETEE